MFSAIGAVVDTAGNWALDQVFPCTEEEDLRNTISMDMLRGFHAQNSVSISLLCPFLWPFIPLLEQFSQGGLISKTLERTTFSNYFDTDLHHDFRQYNAPERTKYSRGGEPYFRPIGCLRFAVKCKGKFENDNWLGTGDGKEVWPIVHHGTKDQAIRSIIREEEVHVGPRHVYGHGVYCTPDPSTALDYASDYTHHGVVYKAIIQFRLRPGTYRKVRDEHNGGLGDYWLVPDPRDNIRLYSLCVFKCGDTGPNGRRV